MKVTRKYGKIEEVATYYPNGNIATRKVFFYENELSKEEVYYESGNLMSVTHYLEKNITDIIYYKDTLYAEVLTHTIINDGGIFCDNLTKDIDGEEINITYLKDDTELYIHTDTEDLTN